MSHPELGETVGSLETTEAQALYSKAVGGKPLTEAKFGGVLIKVLLDTGSQVSTVSEKFYNENLAKIVDSFYEGNLFRLTGANRLEMPYTGIAILDVEIGNTKIKDVGILVVRDTELTADARKEVPGVVGMNCLIKLPQLVSALSEEGTICNTTTVEEPKVGIVKIAGIAGTLVPANSLTKVKVFTSQLFKGTVLIEPIEQSPQGIRLSPTVVDIGKGGTFEIPVLNQSNRDIVLKPRTRVATCHCASEVLEPIKARLDFEVSSNEIIISSASVGERESELNKTCYTPNVDLSHFTGSPTEVERVKALLRKNADVFIRDGEELSCTKSIYHPVNTTDDKPVVQRYRRIPPHQWQAVREHLEDLLRKGIIAESQSNYASPIVILPKKSGEIRVCIDYRKLNAKVTPDVFPLPRIDEALEVLGNAKIFSTLDLVSAYHQIEVKPSDRHKTAFTTPMGLFESVRMPFGLSNSPATFSRLMSHVFREEILAILMVYLDDIIVFSETHSDHLDRLDKVFSRLREHGLKLKAEKCFLFRERVRFLGHVISAKGVETDPDKIRVVKEWPRPSTSKELRSFLGFSSYYRRFVPKFAHIAAPLHGLVAHLTGSSKQSKKQNISIGSEWTAEHEEAFETLKSKLTEAPVLGYPDFSKPFILETHASVRGLGAVLSQQQGGLVRVICYASRGLRGTEKRSSGYSSRKLELLALKWAIAGKFRDYLEGASFIVCTDNNPLSYLMTKTRLPALEQRWANELASFNFTIKYRPALSRLEVRLNSAALQ